MKKQITTIQQYFKDKLISGKYELLKPTSEHVSEVVIDDEFKFAIWTSDLKYFNQYASTYENFILLPEFNQTEQKKALTNLRPRFKEIQKKVVLIEKEKQLKELQNQIQKLKS